MTYLLPGIKDSSFVVMAAQTNVSRAMTGMAIHTGNNGLATSSPMSQPAIGTRKKICIRYMPKVSLARPVINDGAQRIHENSKNAPNVASNTLGVQNCHDHSATSVGICNPGWTFHQKLHAVNAPPMIKHNRPTATRFCLDHFRCTRMKCASTK